MNSYSIFQKYRQELLRNNKLPFIQEIIAQMAVAIMDKEKIQYLSVDQKIIFHGNKFLLAILLRNIWVTQDNRNHIKWKVKIHISQHETYLKLYVEDSGVGVDDNIVRLKIGFIENITMWVRALA